MFPIRPTKSTSPPEANGLREDTDASLSARRVRGEIEGIPGEMATEGRGLSRNPGAMSLSPEYGELALTRRRAEAAGPTNVNPLGTRQRCQPDGVRK